MTYNSISSLNGEPTCLSKAATPPVSHFTAKASSLSSLDASTAATHDLLNLFGRRHGRVRSETPRACGKPKPRQSPTLPQRLQAFHRWTRALPPPMTFSTSLVVAMDVSDRRPHVLVESRNPASLPLYRKGFKPFIAGREHCRHP